MLRATIHKTLGEHSIRAGFSVKANGILAIYGPSGAGKTTIINMLAGLLKPCSGKISFNGNWLYNSYLKINTPPEKRRFGYVFQEGRLFPHLSVKANLNYGRKLAPSSQRYIKTDDVIDLLGIDHLLHRRPAKLSGGEKQRVAIGRALLMSPSLLLMDEPLASLDSHKKKEILPFISSISRDFSIPVIYVSHSLDEIKHLTDDILIINRGVTARRQISDKSTPFGIPGTSLGLAG